MTKSIAKAAAHDDAKADIRFWLSGVSGVAFVSLISGAAMAQQGPSDPQSAKTPLSQLSEVVVTASKKSESLSKAPLSVSVQSQEQLQANRTVTLQDITSTLPNVQFDTQGFSNNVQASIRGITSSQGGEIAQSAVATYVDGVYIPRTSGLSGALFDLDRIEVLRGPQGTLYGINATAGNINIVTAQPVQSFHAAAEASVGNYGTVETRGMINVPISDTLAVRGAFITSRNDGFQDTRGTTVQNYAKTDDRGFRLTGLWRPLNSFSWRLSAEDFQSSGTPFYNVVTGADGAPLNGYSPYSFPTSGVEPQDKVHDISLRSQMNWDITGNLKLTYTAGAAIQKYAIITEWPGASGPLGLQHSSTTNNNNYHEINLTWDIGRFRNVLGGNYSHEGNGAYFDNPLPTLVDSNLIVASHASRSSWGVFDQGTLSVTDAFRLTAGIRYTADHQHYPANAITCPLNTLYFGGSLPLGCLVAPESQGSGSWDKVNWKVGAEYDLAPGTLSYLTVSTGYKTGGLNASGSAAPDTRFNPENVTNYEVGLKTRFLNGRASLNAALFYEDYRDLQVEQLFGFAFVTQNAASAANYGLELEGRWNVTAQDHLNAFATYLHATYLDYTNDVDQHTSINYPSLRGNEEPLAPQESFRLEYTHDFELLRGKLTPSASVYWQATSYLREFNLPIDRVPDYSRTNLSLTYADMSGWNIEGYATNLEDNAIRNGQLQFFGQYYSYYSPPRQYGVRVAFRY